MPTKHNRPKKRYRERLKEIKKVAEVMNILGGSGIHYQREAVKALHRKMQRRGGKYK